MKLTGDYHTHTLYSHGKGSVELNVISAIAKGLKQVAITDHGFRHVAYNVRVSDFKYMVAEVAEIQKKYPQIKILLGLETNIQGMDGKIDIKDEDIDKLELIICGYHKYVYSPNIKDAFGFFLPNLLGGKSARLKERNTQAFINALRRYPIDIISHPKHGIAVDVVAIAEEAKKLGTLMELNGKKVSMTDDEIRQVFKTGVGIIVNSDAHSPQRVGDIRVPLGYIERLKLDIDQIVNFDKIPVFRSSKKQAKNSSEVL